MGTTYALNTYGNKVNAAGVFMLVSVILKANDLLVKYGRLSKGVE